MKRSLKKFFFYCGLFVFVICGIELYSYFFFKIFHERFTFFSLQRYVLPQKRLNTLSSYYDPKLGWDMHYNTPYTERPRLVSYNRPFITTFGDSFTHCDQVEHNETWQTYLSELLEMDVYNFGTGGFGTDQAYLKFLSVYPKVKTPIVILGLTVENINRIVNVYRPFYFPKTGVPLTKPRFIVADEQLVLLENPIKSKAEIKNLGNPRFIRSLGENDWWYNRDNYPVFQFPYSKIFLNKRMWLEASYGKGNRRINDIDPRPWTDLWNEPQVTNLLFKIFESFIKSVRNYGATPIIMILPQKEQVISKFKTGKDHKGVAMILEYCTRKHCLCFDSIAALAKNVTTETDIEGLYIGHVSAKGNRIIAHELFEYIGRHIPSAMDLDSKTSTDYRLSLKYMFRSSIDK